MKIRFSKNDVFDTKGEVEYLDEVAGQVNEVAEAPIYTVQLTEEEVGYIKSFVEFVDSCKDEQHPVIEFGKEEISGVSAMTIYAGVEEVGE